MTSALLLLPLLLGACASAQPTAPQEPPTPAVVRRALAAPEAAPRRASEETPPSLRLMAGGDVVFARYIRGELRFVGGPDPFVHLRPLFRAADLAVINLETPLTDVLPRTRRTRFGDLFFRAPPEMLDHLVDAGIDLAITANNHAEDCGEAGLADTIARLSAAGIAHAGTAADGDPLAPVTVEVDGVRIAVVAATSKRNRGRPRPGQAIPVAYLSIADSIERLPPIVRALREAGDHDLVVVSLHWGAGGERRVHPRQIELAHAVVDAGADLVLGHHAHILQAVEAYGDGFVVYGMGNLVFDMRDRYGRETALFDLRLAPWGHRWRVERLIIRPFLIDAPTEPPHPVGGEEARRLLAPVAGASERRFDTPLTAVGDTLVWRRAPAETGLTPSEPGD